MRIYVASLADYNDGVLFGKWFTIEDYDNAEELKDAIEEMLKESPYLKWLGISKEAIEKHGASNWTEYAVHDQEDLPDFLADTEYPDYEDFYKYLDLVDAVNQDEDAVLAYLDIIDFDSASVSHFNDSFIGKYKTKEDYAEEYAFSCLCIPEELERYFDYEKLADDLFEYDLEFINGYVFRKV